MINSEGHIIVTEKLNKFYHDPVEFQALKDVEYLLHILLIKPYTIVFNGEHNIFLIGLRGRKITELAFNG